ncbi:MAG: DUF2807 domain-containing protein [Prolixibacteraceae bacterium]|nr:DUF2807 domain-containing protein [Prolixibacteraceae bacterium]
MKKLSLFIVSIALIAGTQSCYFHLDDNFCMSGYGSIISEDITLDDFYSVTNYTVVDVEIVQGDEQSVTIEGHENMLDQLQLVVRNEELSIEMKNHCYNNFRLKLYITVPELDKVALKSTGDLYLGTFEQNGTMELSSSSTGDINGIGYIDGLETLYLSTTSTGDIDLEAYTDEVFVDIHGTGDVRLIGSCFYQSIDMRGTGDYDAEDFESEECDISVRGTGNATIDVHEQLDVSISSTGDVYYYGNPSVSVMDNGVGKLIRMN